MPIDISSLPEPLRNANNCQKDPIDGFPYSYGYRPSLAAGIVFCVLFGIAFSGHGFQAIRKRRWTSILLTIGSMTELVGWAGRTWSSECPYNANAYLMQITTLIIAPVFVTAALYVLLGMFINALGRQSSLLSPRVYFYLFFTCDVVSLVIQAVGGAMASIASSNLEDPWPGTKIMIAGVVFQLISMTVFAGLTVDFTLRSARMGRPAEFTGVLAALYISFITVYIRSIFRTIELCEGWSGYLMLHEGYFIGLDGTLMVIAVGIFVLLDPTRMLPEKRPVLHKEYSPA